MDAPRASVLTDAALATALRDAGLRLTRPRKIVYSLLRDLGGHRSADELTESLQKKGRRVSRMSVYNALNDLKRAGVVQHADAGPGRALFEANSRWHHHFVCRRCARVFDVPCVQGKKPCLDLPSAVGRADEAQIIFRGLCRSCRRPTPK